MRAGVNAYMEEWNMYCLCYYISVLLIVNINGWSVFSLCWGGAARSKIEVFAAALL